MATKRDREILNSIINPLMPLGECVYDPEADDDEPADRRQTRTTDHVSSRPEDLRSLALEKSGVEAAERGDIKDALTKFTEAIAVAPDRPSCYNNRAQAHRLQGDVMSALNDLNTCLRLIGDETSQDQQRRVARQVYCQRGLILRKNGDEEGAVADFQKASALGSQFAKTMLVQMNPYAAMCNKMLRDLFSKMEDTSQ